MSRENWHGTLDSDPATGELQLGCLLKNAFDHPLGKSDYDLPTFEDVPAPSHAVQSFLLQHYISKRVVLK